jgi:putative restriction endonuclease
VGIRKGQKTFRKKIVVGAKRCEATLSSLVFATDACHIKPYSICNDSEKEDPNNAILLLSSIHRVFDNGYITFDDDGKIIISEDLDKWEWRCLGISGTEQIRMPGKRKDYMKYHREMIFRDKHNLDI